MVVMLLLAPCTSGFFASTRISYPTAATSRVADVPALMMSGNQGLRTFLLNEAQVSPKFVEAVLAKCDEEMIGDLNGLRIAAEAGLTKSIFKPVIALGIDKGESLWTTHGAYLQRQRAVAFPSLPLVNLTTCVLPSRAWPLFR